MTSDMTSPDTMDLLNTTGNVTFDEGQHNATIHIYTLDDMMPELNEIFVVELTKISGNNLLILFTQSSFF